MREGVCGAYKRRQLAAPGACARAAAQSGRVALAPCFIVDATVRDKNPEMCARLTEECMH